MNHFGEYASGYSQFRPHYPEALFQYLASLTEQHDCVWDVGTGNGQAAVGLSSYFNEVIATDLKQEQLNEAEQKANIRYIACPAEKSSIDDHSLDLITVAQALHWFDLDAFYQEARRTLKSGGVLTAWCYGLFRISPKLDALIQQLYETILGDAYWPKERRYIDQNYQTIPFPFPKIKTPSFIIERPLNFAQCVGYLNTWSALKEYQKRNNGNNPLDLIIDDLQAAWGEPEKEYLSVMIIHLLATKMD